MSKTKLEELFLRISLVDRVSKPGQSLCQTMEIVQTKADAAFNRMRNGATGLVATGLAFQRAVLPADDFARAI